jgi:hypothetical protein
MVWVVIALPKARASNSPAERLDALRAQMRWKGPMPRA